MASRYHQYKEVHIVIAWAVSQGWRWEPNAGKNHIKGELYCPQHDRTGCIIRVSSTPRNAGSHAKTLSKMLNRCPHIGTKPLQEEVPFGAGAFIGRAQPKKD